MKPTASATHPRANKPRTARKAPGPDPAARRAAAAAHRVAMVDVLMQFRVVVRSIRRHYRSVERTCGVSGAQLWAMAQVAAAPGLKVSDLAADLAVHQSTASNILDKLQQAGLVERRRIAEDRRVVRLFVTAKGQRILDKAPKPLRGVLQQALLDLPQPSLRGLKRYLAQLLSHLQYHDSTDTTGPLSDAIGFPRPAPVALHGKTGPQARRAGRR